MGSPKSPGSERAPGWRTPAERYFRGRQGPEHGCRLRLLRAGPGRGREAHAPETPLPIGRKRKSRESMSDVQKHCRSCGKHKPLKDFRRKGQVFQMCNSCSEERRTKHPPLRSKGAVLDPARKCRACKRRCTAEEARLDDGSTSDICPVCRGKAKEKAAAPVEKSGACVACGQTKEKSCFALGRGFSDTCFVCRKKKKKQRREEQQEAVRPFECPWGSRKLAQGDAWPTLWFGKFAPTSSAVCPLG